MMNGVKLHEASYRLTLMDQLIQSLCITVHKSFKIQLRASKYLCKSIALFEVKAKHVSVKETENVDLPSIFIFSGIEDSTFCISL